MSLIVKQVYLVLSLSLIFSCSSKIDPDCGIAVVGGEKIIMKDVLEIGSKLQPIPPLKERMHLSVDVLLATVENEKKIERPIEGSASLRIYRGYLAKLRKDGIDPVAHFAALAKKHNLKLGKCYQK